MTISVYMTLSATSKAATEVDVPNAERFILFTETIEIIINKDSSLLSESVANQCYKIKLN